MNKDLHTKLKDESDFTLTTHERAFLREGIYRYIETHPLVYKATLSPYTFAFVRHVVPLFLLFIVIGSGTAFAAQNALPGDVLYPVKISLNEQVQSALALSPSAKAEVHASLAERRLEEAQALAAKGDLTAENTKVIGANFKEHASVAKLLAQEVGKTDKAKETQLNAQLSSTVVVNGAVLASIASTSVDQDTKADAKSLALDVDSAVSSLALATTTDTQTSASSTLVVASITDGVLARSKQVVAKKSTIATSTMDEKTVSDLALQVSSSIADNLQQLQDAKNMLNASTTQLLQAKIDSLQEKQSHADEAYKAGSYKEAYDQYNQVYTSSLRFGVIVKAVQKFTPAVVMPILTGDVLGTSTSDILPSLLPTTTLQNK